MKKQKTKTSHKYSDYPAWSREEAEEYADNNLTEEQINFAKEMQRSADLSIVARVSLFIFAVLLIVTILSAFLLNPYTYLFGGMTIVSLLIFAVTILQGHDLAVLDKFNAIINSFFANIKGLWK